MPLTGLLSLLDLVVVAEVEPLQTSTRITHLEIGRVAIVSRCDVVGDVAELSVVSSVIGTAQLGLPFERCLSHERVISFAEQPRQLLFLDKPALLWTNSVTSGTAICALNECTHLSYPAAKYVSAAKHQAYHSRAHRPVPVATGEDDAVVVKRRSRRLSAPRLESGSDQAAPPLCAS